MQRFTGGARACVPCIILTYEKHSMKDTPLHQFIGHARGSIAIMRYVGRIIVLLLSLALIVFISYDTFKGINFLESRLYMNFQFWVCIIFLLDFFVQLLLSEDRRNYMARRWFFLLISIPYLNIIEAFNIQFSPEALYYIRFIPLVRGAYTFELVVGYISTNRAFSLLTQYAVLLVSIVYFCSLIFYYEEKAVNSNVSTYWDALYWACMDCSTVGSYINAVTVIGKFLSVVLPVAGIMMLPIFTVFVTSKVKEYNDRKSLQEKRLREEWQHDFAHEADTSADNTDKPAKGDSDFN